jgi:protease YdgD
MHSVLWRGLMAALGLVMATAASGSVIGPAGFHHEAVDERSYPWSSIGKLFNEAGSQCSGVAISRDKVLTAAHCLFNRRSARLVTADSLHFLVGYRAGQPSIEMRVASFEIGAGFDPLRYQLTTDADWAVLTLTEELPAQIAPLPLSREAEPSGTKAILAGYPQDRAFAMTADRNCELGQSIDSGKLLLHTCRGMNGYSGGPVLVSGRDGEVRVAGIQIATMRGGGPANMLAIPAKSIWREGMDAPTKGFPVASVSAACMSDLRGAGGIWLSDIQTRLDPNRLDLSVAIDAVLADAPLNLRMQLASEQAPVVR